MSEMFDEQVLTCQQWLQWAAQALSAVATDPLQEARWLLMAALDCSATELFINPDRQLTQHQSQLLAAQVARYQAGEPLAYILESWSFYGLDVCVTRDTLIPRPETEVLVAALLQHLNARLSDQHNAGSQSEVLRLLDLGTGTGAIALALAEALPQAQVLATDRSLRAVQVAQKNAQRLNLTNIQWASMDWCSALSGAVKFDAIVSNPPYLCADDDHLKTSIRHEPLSALVSGPSGMEDLVQIAEAARYRLKPCGVLMMEHGYDQGLAAREVLLAHGFDSVHTLQDLAGQDRVVVGYWQEAQHG